MEQILNAGYESLPNDSTLTSLHFDGLGGSAELPKKYIIDEERKTSFQRQYGSKETNMGCGAYSVVHSQNAMDAEEGSRKPELSASTYWDIQCGPDYRGSRVLGSYQSDNLQMMKDYKHISDWYWVRGEREIKEALMRNHAVSTGSYQIDWTKTRTNKSVAVISNGASHLFPIVGWDDDKGSWIVKDSSGPTAWDNGYFYVKYGDTGALYTTYAMIDIIDTAFTQQIEQNKADLLEAIKLGITNGNFLEAYASRVEAAVMIYRSIYGKGESFELEATRAQEKGIWNGSRADDFVTRYEVALMTAGAIGVRHDDASAIHNIISKGIMQSAEKSPILRQHLIYVVMRARRAGQ